MLLMQFAGRASCFLTVPLTSRLRSADVSQRQLSRQDRQHQFLLRHLLALLRTGRVFVAFGSLAGLYIQAVLQENEWRRFCRIRVLKP